MLYRIEGLVTGDVVRGDILCMVKGVKVYGESLDDTHAMKISDTSFVVPVRRSDSHIWSSANEPELGKGARRHRRRIRRRNQHQARDPAIREAQRGFINYLRTTGPA